VGKILDTLFYWLMPADIVASVIKRLSSEGFPRAFRHIESISLTQSMNGMVNYLSVDCSRCLRDENVLVESQKNVWAMWRLLLTPTVLYMSLEKQLILDQIPLVSILSNRNVRLTTRKRATVVVL
jgi:hypothetical protein